MKLFHEPDARTLHFYEQIEAAYCDKSLSDVQYFNFVLPLWLDMECHIGCRMDAIMTPNAAMIFRPERPR